MQLVAGQWDKNEQSPRNAQGRVTQKRMKDAFNLQPSQGMHRGNSLTNILGRSIYKCQLKSLSAWITQRSRSVGWGHMTLGQNSTIKSHDN